MTRTRLPSGDEARDGALAQFGVVSAAVASLPDEAFARATRLGTWTVAELVGHLAAAVESIARGLDRPPPPAADTDLIGYLLAMRSVAPAVAQRAIETAAGATPADLRARLAAAAATAEAARDADPTRLVAMRLGSMSLADFLVTRCIEGVIHGLDLRAATGVPEVPDPTALRVVVKAFAALLAHIAPGRAVEVRVPGYVAVQCVEGPRHTRGTPPNVVEAGAAAFAELASGRLDWAAAVASGAVRASGERADLSAYLPLIG